MRFVADFHIHSPYSRATSRLLTLENIVSWAAKKGIIVIGTGDFTHPGWLREIEEKLEESGDGFYKLKHGGRYLSNGVEPRFVISGEISCIYKKDGRLRKIHNLILLPDIESAKRLNTKLSRIGNIEADGRPILGLDSRSLLDMTLETSPDAFFIPAHIWTPWFSLFGSRSGFDSMEECFGDLSNHIYALETGLSSDPPMNRLLSSLDNYILVSNSDAHSPTKLGREANIFDTGLNYKDMIQGMRDGNGFLGTIEFFPEEGKYHLDGHRKCNVCLDPSESISLNNICPVCGNPITIGVLHRIYELADRKEPKLKKPFYLLIPLTEILAEVMDCGAETKKVKDAYERLIQELGPEIDILMYIPMDEIERAGGELLAEAIKRMRMSKVIKKPGYDGEYGRISLFKEGEKELFSAQSFLFRMPSVDKEVDKEYKRDGDLLNVLYKKSNRWSAKDISSGQDRNPIYGSLNPEQKRAVLYNGVHLIIVAGPGSGKTLTLTHRIAHLISSGVARPDQILAITFTRKAAEEMKSRIRQLLSFLDTSGDEIWISTFHSFCLWLLRQKGGLIGIKKDFTVCPEWEAREILERLSPKKRPVLKLLKELPFIKSGRKKLDIEPELNDLFEKYKEELNKLNMLDMADLETKTLELLNSSFETASEISEMRPFIFVDEYQDTNPVQVDILKAIARAGTCRIYAIGDPDQAIYGFRGADRENFFRFKDDFERVSQITLIKNYRSTPQILKASAFIIDALPMEGMVKEKGDVIINSCATEKEEAESVVEQIERLMGGISYFSLDSKRVFSYEGEELSFGDIAILYRINQLGDEIERALRRAGIPVIRAGEVPLREIYPVNIIYRFFQYLLHRDSYHLDGYLRLMSKLNLKPVHNITFPSSSNIYELIDKAIELHALGTLDDSAIKAIDRVKRLVSSSDMGLASFIDLISLERGIDNVELSVDRVSLMSIHSSKGLEWKVVFIIGCEDGIIPCTIFGDTDMEEERRLLYVGMTRAEKLLILSYAKKREIKNRTIYVKPSPFLRKIPDELLVRYEKRMKRQKKELSQLSLF